MAIERRQQRSIPSLIERILAVEGQQAVWKRVTTEDSSLKEKGQQGTARFIEALSDLLRVDFSGCSDRRKQVNSGGLENLSMLSAELDLENQNIACPAPSSAAV